MGLLMHKGKSYGGGLTRLLDMLDVNISNPSNGDLIQYNSTNQKYENSDDVWKTMAKNGAHNLFNEFGLQQGDVLGDGPAVRVSTKLSTDPYVKVGDKIIIRRTQDYTSNLKLSVVYTTKDNVILGYIGFEVLTLNADFVYTAQYEGYMRFVFANYDTTAPITIDDVRNNKILVRLATDANTEYTPYVPTNAELWSKDNQKKNGAYNILENKGKSQVTDGITYVVNSNGTFTASGTSNPLSSLYAYYYIVPDNSASWLRLKAGSKYKFNCCPKGGSTSTYFVQFLYRTEVGGTSLKFGNDTGDGILIEPTADAICYIRLVINKTVQMSSNTVFKPMLTSDLNATYADYVPYAKTNRQLTEIDAFQEKEISVTNGYSKNNTGRLRFQKRNGVVTCLWAGGSPKVPSAGTEYNIATIPSGYVPRFDVYVPCVDLNNFSSGVLFMFKTNGEVHIIGCSTTTDQLVNSYPTVSYVVRD